MVEFEQDAVQNFGYSRRDSTNPFLAPAYSFQAASNIVESLAHGYGKWQNSECSQMKSELMSLAPDGSGRVPLSSFYAQPSNADYQFTESMEYLRDIGALEETSGEPRVRIANYLAGPSNCIASSSYYSVCCISECEAIMNELEGKVRAPTAAASALLKLVGNLTSIDDHHSIPADLSGKLNSIADVNGGQVPLHGRLFAQWLHLAFPYECPYPHVADDAAALTPGNWMEKVASATKEERERLAAGAPTAASSESSSADAKPASDLFWSDHEVLHVMEPQVRPKRGVSSSAVRIVVQIGLAIVVVRTAWTAFQSAAAGIAGNAHDSFKKKTDFELPF